MTPDSKIEAVLFFKGEPTSVSSLSKILDTSEELILEGLTLLESKLTDRGLTLVRNGNEVALATAAGASELIEVLSKEDLERDLSKASLETLAIVLYRGPIGRSEIEYIRGVQSNFILRSLSIRGLIERVENPNDGRTFLYKPTFDLLKHLGISSLEEMPEFSTIQQKLMKVSAPEAQIEPLGNIA
jgi:segregation and condensation protein B